MTRPIHASPPTSEPLLGRTFLITCVAQTGEVSTHAVTVKDVTRTADGGLWVHFERPRGDPSHPAVAPSAMSVHVDAVAFAPEISPAPELRSA